MRGDGARDPGITSRDRWSAPESQCAGMQLQQAKNPLMSTERDPIPVVRSSRFDERVRRIVATRRVFPFLVVATLAAALIAAFLVTLVDEESFPSFGLAVWWAIVTLGTVGYGDVVPASSWGRVVGSGVILFGVTFIAFLTATVTSLFVSNDQDRKAALEAERRAASDEKTHALLIRLDERLASLEKGLEG